MPCMACAVVGKEERKEGAGKERKGKKGARLADEWDLVAMREKGRVRALG